jgi:soluble cytochrome b562
MGLFGKFAKAVIANAAESAGDKKKSDKTATSPELKGMEKEIQEELAEIDKMSEALHKKMKKLPKL